MIEMVDVMHAFKSGLYLWLVLTASISLLTAIDTILGIIIALNPRLKYIRFSSTTLLSRLIKKFVFQQVLILIAIAIHIVSCVIPDTSFASSIITFVSATFFVSIIIFGEVGSILENLKVLGIRVKVFGKDLTEMLIDKWLDATRQDDEKWF